MKCPMCNGSGKCYEQKIRYQEIETNRTDFTIAKCYKCNGTGEVQMTNEERMRTCSTEELATVIYGIAVYDTLYDRINNAVVLNPCEDDSAGINEVMKWLKEKHDGNMG